MQLFSLIVGKKCKPVIVLVFGRFTTANGKPVEKIKIDVRSIFSYLYFLKDVI